MSLLRAAVNSATPAPSRASAASRSSALTACQSTALLGLQGRRAQVADDAGAGGRGELAVREGQVLRGRAEVAEATQVVEVDDALHPLVEHERDPQHRGHAPRADAGTHRPRVQPGVAEGERPPRVHHLMRQGVGGHSGHQVADVLDGAGGPRHPSAEHHALRTLAQVHATPAHADQSAELGGDQRQHLVQAGSARQLVDRAAQRAQARPARWGRTPDRPRTAIRPRAPGPGSVSRSSSDA